MSDIVCLCFRNNVVIIYWGDTYTLIGYIKVMNKISLY